MILRPPGLVALSSVSIAVFAEPFDFYLSSSFLLLRRVTTVWLPIVVNWIIGETKALRQADGTHIWSNLTTNLIRIIDGILLTMMQTYKSAK